MTIALSLLGAIWGFFTDPGTFLTGAAHWMVGYGMPPQLQTWFLGTLGAPARAWDPSVIYQDVFRVVQGPALLITGVAAAGRVVRATLDHRLAAGHVILDTVPRLLVAVAVIGIPGTHVSLGYLVIAFSVDASMTLAQVLFSLLMQASWLQGQAAVQGWLDQLILTLLSNAPGNVLVAAALIPLIVLVLYAFVLMVLRTVMLGFCVATAPLCLATAVFDVNNRFFRWWVDLFIGVLTTPIVLGIAVSLSLTVAMNVAPVQPPIGALLAVIVMCGGLWLAAKMVHALTWRHFGHGGAIAGFTAGVTTMLAPLHKLAEIGHLAETFSGSRSRGGVSGGAGGGARMAALAAQGVAAAGGVLPAQPSAAVAAPDTTFGAGIGATGGPPDIAAALGRSGRAAVAGAEALFSQRAFDAFTRTQTNLVGSLTRDLPAGTVSPAGRATLAWERAPLRAQHEFAEDFLSRWLGTAGGGDGDDAGRQQTGFAPLSVAPLPA